MHSFFSPIFGSVEIKLDEVRQFNSPDKYTILDHRFAAYNSELCIARMTAARVAKITTPLRADPAGFYHWVDTREGKEVLRSRTFTLYPIVGNIDDELTAHIRCLADQNQQFSEMKDEVIDIATTLAHVVGYHMQQEGHRLYLPISPGGFEASIVRRLSEQGLTERCSYKRPGQQAKLGWQMLPNLPAP